MVAGHFTGDGRLELAVLEQNTDKVSILGSDVRGEFHVLSQISLTDPQGLPKALAAGDFNGDGVDDLAVVSEGSDGSDFVSVMLGMASGTFDLLTPIFIGTGLTPTSITLHPDVKATFDATVKLLGELGHTMIELPTLGVNLRKLYKAQGFVSGAMSVVGYEEWAEQMQRPLDETTLEWLALIGYRAAQQITPKDVAWGLQTIRLIGREILALYRGFDVLLQPMTLTPPPPLGFLDPTHVRAREFNRRQGQIFGLTPLANLTGQPSMSLPLGMSKDKLPIGMMFSGRYGDEATLFRLAAQLEQASPWIDRKPPVWG